MTTVPARNTKFILIGIQTMLVLMDYTGKFQVTPNVSVGSKSNLTAIGVGSKSWLGRLNYLAVLPLVN